MSITCAICLFLLWVVSYQSHRLIRTGTLLRTMKPLFCLASSVGHSLLQTCLTYTLQRPRTAVTGDSISSVDKTADNHSNDINIAINAAAEAMSGSPDTCQTSELASQSTGNAGNNMHTPTGNAAYSLYALGGVSVDTAACPSDSWI